MNTTAISSLPTSEHQKNFYPTPRELAEKLLDGLDWNRVESVLEPSAGKGDLAMYAIEKLAAARYRTGDMVRPEDYDVDCVEIDPDLRALLKGKGLRVVHDDFLTFATRKRYHLILMNPPFDRGAEHLLKAISLLEPYGGQIACIRRPPKKPCPRSSMTAARRNTTFLMTIGTMPSSKALMTQIRTSSIFSNHMVGTTIATVSAKMQNMRASTATRAGSTATRTIQSRRSPENILRPLRSFASFARQFRAASRNWCRISPFPLPPKQRKSGITEITFCDMARIPKRRNASLMDWRRDTRRVFA